MSTLKKRTAVVMLVLMVWLCLPKAPAVLAEELPSSPGKITEHEPQGSATTEIETQKKSGAKWLWALLGLVVVGGVAAVAAGGGDSGGGGGGDGEVTGSFEASW